MNDSVTVSSGVLGFWVLWFWGSGAWGSGVLGLGFWGWCSGAWGSGVLGFWDSGAWGSVILGPGVLGFCGMDIKWFHFFLEIRNIYKKLSPSSILASTTKQCLNKANKQACAVHLRSGSFQMWQFRVHGIDRHMLYGGSVREPHEIGQARIGRLDQILNIEHGSNMESLDQSIGFLYVIDQPGPWSVDSKML